MVHYILESLSQGSPLIQGPQYFTSNNL